MSIYAIQQYHKELEKIILYWSAFVW